MTPRQPKYFTTAALALFVAALGKCFLGYSLGSTNAALRPMSTSMGWCQNELIDWMQPLGECPAYTDCSKNNNYIPFITASATFGGVVGNYSSAMISQKGRRFGLIVLNIVGLIGCVINTSAVNFGLIVTGRLILGFSMGGFGFLAPQYINEIAPPATRGFYNGFSDLFLVGGVLTATLFGLVFKGTPEFPEDENVICGSADSSYDLSDCGETPLTDGEYFCGFDQDSLDSWWWRFVMAGFVIPIAAIALVLLFFVFKFETPYWNLLKGNDETAVKVLQNLRNSDDVETELGGTKWYLEECLKAEGFAKNQGFIEFNKEPKARFAIWTGILLGLLNTTSGSVPMSFLSVVLFLEAGMTESMATVMSVMLIVGQMVAVVISMMIMDRLGRKPILIFTTVVCFVGVAIPSISLIIDESSSISLNLAIAGSMIFIIGYTIGLACLTYTIIFEMFPPHMRYNGQKISCTAAWLGNLLEFFTVPLMTTKQIFIKSSILTFVAIMMSVFMIKETKGLAVGESPYFPGMENVASVEEKETDDTTESDPTLEDSDLESVEVV